MGQTHSLLEHYTKLYLCALSSLAEEYVEWKTSSQPSIHTKSPPSKSCKPQEEVSLPPEIEVNVCERETPSHQDLSTPPNQPLQEDVPVGRAMVLNHISVQMKLMNQRRKYLLLLIKFTNQRRKYLLLTKMKPRAHLSLKANMRLHKPQMKMILVMIHS